jgi:PIN domain nuclease of toxin-antitoxin system
VSGYLLDTNAALIALTDPDRLPAAVRTALLAGPNILSVVSYWEVLLKSMKGRLKVGDPRTWWPDALDQLGATPLALRRSTWRRFTLCRRSIKIPSTGS